MGNISDKSCASYFTLYNTEIFKIYLQNLYEYFFGLHLYLKVFFKRPINSYICSQSLN